MRPGGSRSLPGPASASTTSTSTPPPGRGHGRQRAHLEHRQRRRAHRRPAAGRARHIAVANQSLKRAEWRRGAFTGTELYEKTAGIVGLGRIGVLVAQRLSAFGMRVIAYDPYVQAGRAAQMGVRLVGFDQLLAESDAISVHLPEDPRDRRAHRRRAAAQGQARRPAGQRRPRWDRRRAGAARRAQRRAGGRRGLDVYATEPCTDSPLFALDNVVATPHLGASTAEAQEKAGVAVARSVRLALTGELVPDAVNVQGGAIAEDVAPASPSDREARPHLQLARRRHRPAARRRGARRDHRPRRHRARAGRPQGGVRRRGREHRVVRQRPAAGRRPRPRGAAGHRPRQPRPPQPRHVARHPCGRRQVSVSGTLVGIQQRERLVEVDGFDVEMEPTDHLLVARYDDRPGMIGSVGNLLGDAGINIAGMQVSRDRRGGRALVVIAVDSAVSVDRAEGVREAMAADWVRRVNLAG